MKDFLLKTLIGVVLFFGIKDISYAQENRNLGIEESTSKYKRAWEIGIGGTGLQMTRFGVLDFKMNENTGGYFIDTSKKDALFGGNIYLARELHPNLYIDLQGTFGYTSDRIRNGYESRWLAMAGLGLQWRLGEYFNSKYIDPYFRVGANYMHKSFDIFYNGIESLDTKEMTWELENLYNKTGADRRDLVPISFGTGVNMWLNDRFGIGLQADYLLMPYKNVANSWQGTVRVMWRIGGKPKKSAPQVQYVETVIEKPIEKIVEVEKLVEAPAVKATVCELFNNVDFDFDKATITAESQPIIDQIANLITNNQEYRYLIIGSTDAKGSEQYNIDLSQRRAKAVVEALIERGVPKHLLKFRGIGKKISYAPSTAPDDVRRGDRKVYVEIITNMTYWDYIKN